MAEKQYKEMIQQYKQGPKIDGLNQVTFNRLEDEFSEDMEQKIRYYLFRKSLNIEHTYKDSDDAIKPYKVEGISIEDFILDFENEKKIKKLNILQPLSLLFEDSVMEYGLVSQYDNLRGEDIFYDAVIISSLLYTYGELMEIARVVNESNTTYIMEVYPSKFNPYYEKPCSSAIVIIKNIGRIYIIDD